MLKKLTLTLLLAGALPLTSRADEVEVDGIRYITNPDDHTATVTYVKDSDGNKSFEYDDLYQGNITIPATIDVDWKTYTVTSIGEYAFSDCYNLNSISLPNTVTSIGEYAFNNCNFLNNISLPNTVTSIGDWAFSYCQYLDISLPNTVTTIGEWAFTGCGLSNIILPESVQEIKTGTFYGCGKLTTIKLSNVHSIGDEAFRGCNALQDITLSNVRSIGDRAFYSSNVRVAIINFLDLTPPSLGSNSFSAGNVFIVPDDAKKEYQTVLSDYNSLILAQTEIDINETITDYEIKSTAIENSSALVKELIKSVGLNFDNIKKLKLSGTLNQYDFSAIKLLENLTHIDVSDVIFDSNILDANAFSGLAKLESAILPNSLTEIGNNAFHNCSSLKSINNLSALTNIGNLAFDGCKSLQSIGDLPSLTSIGNFAFYYCSNLKSLGKTPKLESIGSDAFTYCSKMTELNLPETLTKVATNAFSEPTLVHFAGATPPIFNGTEISTVICVPMESVEAYAKVLPDMPMSNILAHESSYFDINVSAREYDSDVLNKINAGFDVDVATKVASLKVRGTINSYDIIAFRNKMLNLRILDLSNATIVGCSYEYYTNCHTEANIIGNNMFSGLKNLREIYLPDNATKIGNNALSNCSNLISVHMPNELKSIGNSAFSGCMKISEIILPEHVTTIGNDAFHFCSGLQNITLPKDLTTIGTKAFSYCGSLKEIILPPLLTNIPTDCFYRCSALKSISLPPTIKRIEAGAFAECFSLIEFHIPAGITFIGGSSIPGSVKDVYTYTIQPTNIGQNTFDSSTYLDATLHVPETSESLYYWDTQWSQFQSITNFNEPYSYFYLTDKDLIEDPDTPRIDGAIDEETGDKKNPDADLGEGSGLIVDGDNSQDLGNVDLDHDGKENGATIIGGNSNTSESGGNVNIDMLNIKIPVVAKKWYFFSFPFDIELSNIKFNGQMVWRYYDGEWRAMHGSGSWKDMKGEKLERGRGYIFQASKAGTLTLSIPNASFNANDWKQQLEQYISENAQDASWNFIGNPFQSYYELADLGFDGPITWWNPNTNSYEAFSPLDDDMSMYPFMAFFVQKPEGVDEAEFFGEYRETKNQKDDPNHRASAKKRRMARRARAAADRMLVNLTVTDGNNSDRTRVVFNNKASEAYEVGVDASKFVSGEAPQIYSLDALNVRYAINERPAGDGVVRLGFYAPASGTYTLQCQRNDCPVTLKDCLTGMTIELNAETTYEFLADKGYDETRFILNANGEEESSIESVTAADPADAKYYRINGMETDGSQRGLKIEVKGNEAKKVIRE